MTISTQRDGAAELAVPVDLLGNLRMESGTIDLQAGNSELDGLDARCRHALACPRQQNDGSLNTDRDLWSATELTNCTILAEDGELGHIEDLVLHLADWHVPYVVVNAWNWLPGRKLLIATASLVNLDRSAAEVRTNLRHRQVRSAPPFDPKSRIDPGYEDRLHTHYGLPRYWSVERKQDQSNR